jgi:hypothetical protein
VEGGRSQDGVIKVSVILKRRRKEKKRGIVILIGRNAYHTDIVNKRLLSRHVGTRKNERKKERKKEKTKVIKQRRNERHSKLVRNRASKYRMCEVHFKVKKSNKM